MINWRLRLIMLSSQTSKADCASTSVNARRSIAVESAESLQVRRLWRVGTSLGLLGSFGAGLPGESFAQDAVNVASPDFVKALGAYLSAGVIGLGLGVAVLATIVVIFGRAGTKFMLFGLALVVLGAGIEITKNVLQWRDIDTLQIMSLNLPPDVWLDFRTARKQAEFGTAAPAGEDYEIELKKGQSTTLTAHIPKGECRYYFIATKPPGRLEIQIDNRNVQSRVKSSKGYYQTGTMCVPPNDATLDAKMDVKIQNIDSTVFFVAFVAPPDPTLINVAGPPPGPLAEMKKVVCTGEFESNCAGAHDIFLTCSAPAIPEIARNTCTGLGRTVSGVLRTNMKGGNKCGYDLIEVTCK
jgi:hypothetical protein